MNLFQGIKMAYKSIMSNKMRSFLTMLGIIIGVSSVILLVALSQGSSTQITEQVQGLGANLLTVNIFGRGTQSTLEYTEALGFSELDGIEAVAPIISSNVTAKNGTNNVSVTIEGISPDYETVRDSHVQSGRFILPIDLEYRQKVAVIGTATAEELYGLADPVGQYVQINGTPFKIVGLLEEKGDSMMGSNDEIILIPISTAERILAMQGVRQIYVLANSTEDVSLAEQQLETHLTQLFRGNSDSFTIFNQQQMIESVSSVQSTMTLLLGGIASISLLVGGIGIMNIMLVSVTERTREIGIRKAIGAKKRYILFQFLVEAMVLSGAGGLLGIILGVTGAIVVGNIIQINAEFSIDIIWLAFGFSVLVGVCFGIFPANKAAKLKPIDALRTE